MESRKVVQVNLFQGSSRHQHRERTCGPGGGLGEWDKMGD